MLASRATSNRSPAARSRAVAVSDLARPPWGTRYAGRSWSPSLASPNRKVGVVGPDPRDLEDQPLAGQHVDDAPVDSDADGVDVGRLAECVVELVQSTKHRRGAASCMK